MIDETYLDKVLDQLIEYYVNNGDPEMGISHGEILFAISFLDMSSLFNDLEKKLATAERANI